MTELITEIDGVAFYGRFAGFAENLHIRLDDGDSVVLAPWTYRAHLAAMSECVVICGDAVALDERKFAARVLDHSGVHRDVPTSLAPLLLWWAAGGEDDLEPGNPLDLGSVRAWLRPWSEGERLTAFAAARQGGGEHAMFDGVGYFAAMLAASVVSLVPQTDPAALDARATARLLNGVAHINVHDRQTDPLFATGAGELTAGLLPLCRALGWSLAEILAKPAVEVERLRRLLELDVTPAEPHTRLAEQPGATVILFSDP